jgi:hypothetical protein
VNLDRHVAGCPQLPTKDTCQDLVARHGAIAVCHEKGQQIERTLLQGHGLAIRHQHTAAIIDQERPEGYVGSLGNIEHS